MAADLKIKTAAAKAPLQMLPLGAFTGAARVVQYGRKKYAPGNYLRATLEDGCGERYAGAALRHLRAIQEDDGLWTRESLSRLDVESGLPEIDHAICSLMMLRSILIKQNVLAEDPGEGKDPPAAAPVGRPDWDERDWDACIAAGACSTCGGERLPSGRWSHRGTCPDWGPVDEPPEHDEIEARRARPTEIGPALCECGHQSNDHTARGRGICTVQTDDGTNYVDDCEFFRPAPAIKVA